MPHPLHPAIVHIPLVLALFLPLVSAAAAVYIASRGRGSSMKFIRVWWIVVALNALLVASAWVTIETGERDESAVEAIVPERALDAHEDAATGFLALAAATLVISVAGTFASRVGSVSRSLAVVLGLAVLAAGVNVGDAGGKLVYRHGAASAYNTVAVAPGGASPADTGEGERDDD